jgi:hypothetical protein
MALFWAADSIPTLAISLDTKHVFPRYEGTGKAAAMY